MDTENITQNSMADQLAQAKILIQQDKSRREKEFAERLTNFISELQKELNCKLELANKTFNGARGETIVIPYREVTAI